MSRLAALGSGRVTWARVGVAAAAALAVGVLTGLIPLPSVGDLLAGLSDALGAWAYLLLPALAFLETAAFIGLAVPGETAVLVGGVVAERGDVLLVPFILLVWAAAFAGDVTSFLLGRRLGRPFLDRHAGRLHVRVEQLDRVEGLFDRHGGKAIVLGRFVGVLRAFTPFIAGTSGMPLRRFIPYSLGASLAWAAGLTLVGYAFSSSIGAAGDVITRVTLAAAVLAGLALWIRRARRSHPARPRRANAPVSAQPALG